MTTVKAQDGAAACLGARVRGAMVCPRPPARRTRGRRRPPRCGCRSCPRINECTSPNRTHGPPLAFPSCNPPVQTSSFLTVGTPDANGAPANSGVRQVCRAHTPGPPPETRSCSRRASPTSAARPARPPAATRTRRAGPTTRASCRRTRRSGSPITTTRPARAAAPTPRRWWTSRFPCRMPCVSTADPSIGRPLRPRVRTATPVAVPSAWFNGKRVVVGMTQFEVFDGGADGVVGTAATHSS